ncbi:MAG: hypothetical protein D6712_03700 [Chloroflexi bacterium]|nr:MAG: hypothetical protein D6712_03700 [Chloroflexota bacterium]
MAYQGLGETARDLWRWVVVPLLQWIWRVTYEVQPQDVIATFYMVAAPVMAILHFSGQSIGLSYLDSIGVPWWLQVGSFLVAGWVLINDQKAWVYMVACIPSVGYACGLLLGVYMQQLRYPALLPAIYLIFWGILAGITIRQRYEIRRLIGLIEHIERELENGRREAASGNTEQPRRAISDRRIHNQSGA